MPRNTRRRLIIGTVALSGLAVLAGCRPNIPLIPGIRGQTPPIEATQSAPGLPQTTRPDRLAMAS